MTAPGLLEYLSLSVSDLILTRSTCLRRTIHRVLQLPDYVL